MSLFFLCVCLKVFSPRVLPRRGEGYECVAAAAAAGNKGQHWMAFRRSNAATPGNQTYLCVVKFSYVTVIKFGREAARHDCLITPLCAWRRVFVDGGKDEI